MGINCFYKTFFTNIRLTVRLILFLLTFLTNMWLIVCSLVSRRPHSLALMCQNTHDKNFFKRKLHSGWQAKETSHKILWKFFLPTLLSLSSGWLMNCKLYYNKVKIVITTGAKNALMITLYIVSMYVSLLWIQNKIAEWWDKSLTCTSYAIRATVSLFHLEHIKKRNYARRYPLKVINMK
jgi:hypothetical protein